MGTDRKTGDVVDQVSAVMDDLTFEQLAMLKEDGVRFNYLVGMALEGFIGEAIAKLNEELEKAGFGAGCIERRGGSEGYLHSGLNMGVNCLVPDAVYTWLCENKVGEVWCVPIENDGSGLSFEVPDGCEAVEVVFSKKGVLDGMRNEVWKKVKLCLVQEGEEGEGGEDEKPSHLAYSELCNGEDLHGVLMEQFAEEKKRQAESVLLDVVGLKGLVDELEVVDSRKGDLVTTPPSVFVKFFGVFKAGVTMEDWNKAVKAKGFKVDMEIVPVEGSGGRPGMIVSLPLVEYDTLVGLVEK